MGIREIDVRVALRNRAQVKRKEGLMLKLFTTAKPLKTVVESFNQTPDISPAPSEKRVFRLGLGTDVFYGDGANGYRAIEEECGTSSFTIE